MHILIIEDEKRNFNRLKRLLEEIDGTFRIDGRWQACGGGGMATGTSCPGAYIR
mgnify:CR=1 FL=1